MTDKKVLLNDEMLMHTNGGAGRSELSTVTVYGVGQGETIALRRTPAYTDNVIAALTNGAQLSTDGNICSGTGYNNAACQYMHVCYLGSWGYVNTAFVH